MDTDTPITDPTLIELSEEQQTAAIRMKDFLDAYPDTRRPFFVLDGYAGTGKSFAINTIVKQLGLRAQYMAYTGKAALVLRKYSKVDARTIHSVVYEYVPTPDYVIREMDKQLAHAQEVGDKAQIKGLENEIEKAKQPQFRVKENPWKEIPKPDVIILDECSMVDQEMLADICSLDVPVIALGDPGQLPPVGGTGALFTSPADAQLREIRRQALDNPIISWSMKARQQITLPMTYPDDVFTDAAARVDKATVMRDDLFWRLWEYHDVCICWKNATRQDLNGYVRKRLGLAAIDPIYPVVGDRLIITKNNKELGIFNGLFCEVTEVLDQFDTTIEVKVMTELGQDLKLKLLKAHFESYTDKDALKRLRPWDYVDTQEADYAYCITCHKSQGSQWPKVLVLDENVFNWYKDNSQELRAQWIYTAVTRAIEKVTIVSGKWA